ncbi:pRiA4b ORF-3-like protein [Lishizhenia tianjinensis]|uniref:PRiA4b ORF-3-like protein n=1 Tax=Lishizhenia tianjinensis TaxID=477690 RepID=A0A1I6XVF9_9FLAO|nr:hypothetical protein [Lishizhenia tianjinensis]SFT42485.1 pRiA4b ORF-3-like protein [Lishizhenia tianjinensis]
MSALKFRVLLDSETKEEVFRDILIHDEANFETFYNTILEAFNFKGGQMASFYSSNEDWDKGQEIGLMDMSFGDETDADAPLVMSNTSLKQLIESPEQKFILVHDFLNMWIFLIELQSIEKTPVDEPQVILAIGDAPDENSKQGNEDIQFSTEQMSADDYLDGFDEFDDFDEEYSSSDFDNIDDLDI